MTPNSLLAEVRDFLRGLARELPVLAPPRAEVPGRGGARRLSYRGAALVLETAPAPGRGRSRLEETERGLLLLRSEEDQRPPRELVRDWYREKAQAVFSERSARWARAMGVSYRRVAVKDQRTLWGSCSQAGNLNFNWRLLMAPPEVLDYLVIHELAHLVEMNHSRRFWAVVARHCPEHKERRAWLRENGRSLQRRLGGRGGAS